MSAIHFYKNPSLWIIIVFLLITIVFIYWEYKKRKAWLNYLATVLLAFSMLMIYLRPAIEVNKPLQSLVLIGDGVNSQLLDSLLSQRKYPVFVQAFDSLSGLNQFSLQGSKNPVQLHSWEKQADTIFTIGHIPHMPLNYQHRQFLSNPPAYDIDYSRTVQLGDTLKVAVTNKTGEEMNVVISVAREKPLEKKVLAGKTLTAGYKMELSGNIRSSISINKAINYELNTRVEESEALLVLLLAESPDFEWKFLNNFLANKGHGVFWKTRVSKDIFKTQFTNWPDSMKMYRNKESYSNYDLIITDVQAWNALTYGSQKEIIEATKSSNLACVFRTNEGTNMTDKTGQLSVRIKGGELVNSNVLQTVQNSALAGWKRLNDYQYIGDATNASGLALLSLQNSYVWVLNGENEQYDSFWDDFINALMVKERKEFIFSDALAFKSHPFTISKWDRDASNELIIIDSQADTLKLKAKNNSLMAERQAYEFNPAIEGWHNILLADGNSLPFYVHSETLIKDALGQAFYQYNYNKALESERGSLKNSNQLKNRQDITIWFFVLMLLCFSYLWIEEKIK